jgi:hypothetical protein
MNNVIRRTVDPSALKIVLSLVIEVRIIKHCFRGYASDVKASTTECTTFFYACCLNAKQISPGLNLTYCKREKEGKRCKFVPVDRVEQL